MRRLFAAALTAFAVQALHAAPAGVYLQDLTSTEVRDALRDGTRMVIIPVGGTEQSGPHLTLGKHNRRVQVLAGRIAQELGHTLVAPVVAYVPEGSIDPPSGHMRFPGTISVPDDAFRGVIEGAARSLARHGFTDIVLIGDHGDYQAQLKAVADRLNREWKGGKARVHFIGAYYAAAQAPYERLLRDVGLSDAQIGLHAGAADTSLQLALDPASVRSDKLPVNPADARALGVTGDPRPASAELGRLGADLIVRQTVAAIRQATAH
ncbi:MAG TPA: creatininase family protein [Rubrivivax sp.]|nr:creatininase family protein [Rubrivivax sp.]HRY90124.1 creatininase family protein [Rubrivivax sp.]HRZ61326.1 creatininase family protein [Rubrivivax sp.]